MAPGQKKPDRLVPKVVEGKPLFRPFLVVGVGGSGGKTLRATRQEIHLRLERNGWHGGWPEAWQFLHIDSLISQDGLEFPSPLLPNVQYLSLLPEPTGYESLHAKALAGLGEHSKDIEQNLPPLSVITPINSSPPTQRAFGRALAAASLNDIHTRVQEPLSKMQSPAAYTQLKEIAKLFGVEVSTAPDPVIIVISSMMGLTGSGIFIDVAETIKAAIGDKEWAERIFSILFTPEVIENLGRNDCAHNALGALAELTSGYWNSTPTEATLALYEKNGFTVPQTKNSTVGVAFNYMVGARNSRLSFERQNDVYGALSKALATWISDVDIQKAFFGHAAAESWGKSTSLPDHTQLTSAAAGQPLSSLGFATVSLGTDGFLEYSAERLARSALENILYKHIEEDKLLGEKTEEQWRQEKADLSFGAFLEDAGLDQQTQENNQVLNALRPSGDELQARMKAAIESAARGGMPQGGHSYSAWVERIYNGYEVNLPSLLGENRANLVAKVRDWVDQISDVIMGPTAQTISRQGLPVTVELLTRSINHTHLAIAQLKEEHKRFHAETENLKTLIEKSIEPASVIENIPYSDPVVAEGIHQAELAFYWRCESDLREVSAEVLADFLQNFLEPLRHRLAGATNTLRDSVNNHKLIDGRENPYRSWPDAADQTVPKRFKPAPNERLLIEYTTYRDEFDRLVNQTVSDPKRDAKRVVLDEFMMGSYGIDALEGLREDQQWKLIDVEQMWVPQNRRFQSREGAPQPARFDFLTDHMQYVDRAKLWLSIPGRTFNAYIDQTLADWLGGDKDLQAARFGQFVEALEFAIQSADPLVELDEHLLAEIHGPVGVMAICSGIPVSQADPLRAEIDKALLAKGYDPAHGWYISGSKAERAKSIDIITQLAHPINPIPMASLMKPITKEWLRTSGSRDGRTHVRFRRGRPLPESIPAPPDIWRQMVSGWFVGKMFGLLKLDRDITGPALEEKGPKLSIWVDGGQKGVGFPYPLYYAGIAPTPDLLGVVLESLTVALVNSYSEGSLSPLAPYQKLIDLGDISSPNSDLHHWIRKGVTRSPDAPPARVENVGDSSMTARERKHKCLEYIHTELAKFNHHMEETEQQKEVEHYPVSWQIRKEIRAELNEIMEAIADIEEIDDDAAFT